MLRRGENSIYYQINSLAPCQPFVINCKKLKIIFTFMASDKIISHWGPPTVDLFVIESIK